MVGAEGVPNAAEALPDESAPVSVSTAGGARASSEANAASRTLLRVPASRWWRGGTLSVTRIRPEEKVPSRGWPTSVSLGDRPATPTRTHRRGLVPAPRARMLGAALVGIGSGRCARPSLVLTSRPARCLLSAAVLLAVVAVFALGACSAPGRWWCALDERGYQVRFAARGRRQAGRLDRREDPQRPRRTARVRPAAPARRAYDDHPGRPDRPGTGPFVADLRERLAGPRPPVALTRRPGLAARPGPGLRILSALEVSPSPVYGARLLSGLRVVPSRGFKSRHLRRTPSGPPSRSVRGSCPFGSLLHVCATSESPRPIASNCNAIR